MPDDFLHNKKDVASDLTSGSESSINAAREAEASKFKFIAERTIESQRKIFAKEKALFNDEHVAGKRNRLEWVKNEVNGSSVKGLPLDGIVGHSQLSPLEVAIISAKKIQNCQYSDLPLKTEVFKRIMSLSDEDQVKLLKQLTVHSIFEIRGLQGMRNFPNQSAPAVIAAGEIVDLKHSYHATDKAFSQRDPGSYNCVDFALNRMDGGHATANDGYKLGQFSLIHRWDFDSLDIKEAGTPRPGDLVLINEDFVWGFEHAAVVEKRTPDGKLIVIQKLGSSSALPVIRQTLDDFKSTWQVKDSKILFMRKQTK